MAADHPEKPSLAASLISGGDADDHGTTSVLHHHDLSPPNELDDDSSEDFEFAFVVGNAEALPSATADEIFSDGRILPSYPLFNRDLLLLPHPDHEREAEADASSDMADRIPLRRLLLDEKEAPSGSSAEVPEAAGEYCSWKPDRCKKSASTGSSLRWRLRDLMVGRSQSDGKDKFVFLQAAPATGKRANASETRTAAKPGKGGAKKGVRVTEMDVATAHRLYYGKGASEKAANGPRRSFLPYRQELFGLFAPANTLHRTNHLF